MKLTKEELDQVRSNPYFRNLAEMFGLDFNKLVDKMESENVETKPNTLNNAFTNFDPFTNFNNIKSSLDKMAEDGKLKKFTDNGVTHYYTNSDVNKLEQNNEKTKSNFVMSKQEFVKFIKAYSELMANKNKLSYLFGIELDEAPSGFSFVGKVQDIIWEFVRIIFGEDNRDDIADFVYGNSNFDTAEDLYEELL